MSYLQKTWPLAASISAHTLVLGWAYSAYTLPRPVEAHTEPMVVRLIDIQPKPTKITAIKPIPETRIGQPKASASPAPTPVTTAVPLTSTVESVTAVATSMPDVAHPVRTVEEFTPPSFSAEYLHNPTPEYPPLARRRGEQGRVVLHVTVSESGSVTAINISQSSGFALLDQSALATVRVWRFVPAKFNNHPTVGEVTVPVRFTLES